MQGPMPLVDLVQRVNLQTTPRAISDTLENAVRSGAIEKVGHEKRAHCAKWVAIYDIAKNEFEPQQFDGGIVLLSGVMRDWR
jgi:hypothetical protein